MELDGEVGRSIQRTKGKVHAGTSASSTGFRQENANRGGCVRLCNGRSTVDGMWRWTVATSSIPLKVVEWNQKEL